MLFQDWYAASVARLDNDDELNEHRATILYGWTETDHYEWAATADRQEILDWCAAVEHGA
jgi:hypothetical protein